MSFIERFIDGVGRTVGGHEIIEMGTRGEFSEPFINKPLRGIRCSPGRARAHRILLAIDHESNSGRIITIIITVNDLEDELGSDISTFRDHLPPVGSMTVEDVEKSMILKSLEYHGGNVTRAAGSLGLSRAALYRRLDKYGIEP